MWVRAGEVILNLKCQYEIYLVLWECQKVQNYPKGGGEGGFWHSCFKSTWQIWQPLLDQEACSQNQKAGNQEEAQYSFADLSTTDPGDRCGFGLWLWFLWQLWSKCSGNVMKWDLKLHKHCNFTVICIQSQTYNGKGKTDSQHVNQMAGKPHTDQTCYLKYVLTIWEYDTIWEYGFCSGICFCICIWICSWNTLSGLVKIVWVYTQAGHHPDQPVLSRPSIESCLKKKDQQDTQYEYSPLVKKHTKTDMGWTSCVCSPAQAGKTENNPEIFSSAERANGTSAEKADENPTVALERSFQYKDLHKESGAFDYQEALPHHGQEPSTGVWRHSHWASWDMRTHWTPGYLRLRPLSLPLWLRWADGPEHIRPYKDPNSREGFRQQELSKFWAHGIREAIIGKKLGFYGHFP